MCENVAQLLAEARKPCGVPIDGLKRTRYSRKGKRCVLAPATLWRYHTVSRSILYHLRPTETHRAGRREIVELYASVRQGHGRTSCGYCKLSPVCLKNHNVNAHHGFCESMHLGDSDFVACSASCQNVETYIHVKGIFVLRSAKDIIMSDQGVYHLYRSLQRLAQQGGELPLIVLLASSRPPSSSRNRKRCIRKIALQLAFFAEGGVSSSFSMRPINSADHLRCTSKQRIS